MQSFVSVVTGTTTSDSCEGLSRWQVWQVRQYFSMFMSIYGHQCSREIEENVAAVLR
jgi:hypothetical protein